MDCLSECIQALHISLMHWQPGVQTDSEQLQEDERLSQLHDGKYHTRLPFLQAHLIHGSWAHFPLSE